MPVFMKFDGVDGQFGEADRFDFSDVTNESAARTNKLSLVVKFDIGGAPNAQTYGGSHALYQDVFIPAVQTDDGLLLPAVQTDYDLLLPY